MSRFVNAAEGVTISLGPCQCPGVPRPHIEDAVEILAELPYAVMSGVAAAGSGAGDGPFNFVEARLKLVELGVLSWNLLGPNGEAWPPSAMTIRLLRKETVDLIAGELNARNKGLSPLPNRRGAPSANGSPGSASQTRAKRRQRRSTTSS